MRRTVTGRLLLVAAAAVAAPAALQAQAEASAGSGSADSVAVVASVESFHAALVGGDTAAVERLLAPDVLVLEAGGVEDRTEYLAHHLPADMAFSAAVPAVTKLERVEVRGDVAWVVTTSRRRGTFHGRGVNSFGAEMVVLGRDAEGWRIEAVHWSSRSP